VEKCRSKIGIEIQSIPFVDFSEPEIIFNQFRTLCDEISGGTRDKEKTSDYLKVVLVPYLTRFFFISSLLLLFPFLVNSSN
jgi:hypothetical protein